MVIDKQTDVAYILLNAEDSNKLKDGSHDSRAERFDIDYFIRSVLVMSRSLLLTRPGQTL